MDTERKDFLSHSALLLCGLSLPLKVLGCVSSIACMGLRGIRSSFLSILLFVTQPETQVQPQDRGSFPDELIESVSASFLHPASPACGRYPPHVHYIKHPSHSPQLSPIESDQLHETFLLVFWWSLVTVELQECRGAWGRPGWHLICPGEGEFWSCMLLWCYTYSKSCVWFSFVLQSINCLKVGRDRVWVTWLKIPKDGYERR